MAELEEVLVPRHQRRRQSVFVLRGLGGIGKTQLAVEFASQQKHRFSSVFWLDGRSEDSLLQSIGSHASRIPEGQISESSRTYCTTSDKDIKIVVKEVMGWLAQDDNTEWLLIFDNVDLVYRHHNPDPDAYDVTKYFSGADHGSILITTRLAELEQLGDSQHLGKVDKGQARAIFETWYKRRYDTDEGDRLLALLDGLPLAIAQAASFLQESGITLSKYIEFYEQKWRELMGSGDWQGAPLQDYAGRSVWTTWAISFDSIRDTYKPAAKLLLLWAFLDRKDLWYGLFAAAYSRSEAVRTMLSECLGEIVSDELEFSKAIGLLRSYSLIEDNEDLESYATHPVVHTWAYYFQDEGSRQQLARLAVIMTGSAVPTNESWNSYTFQRRLLPHAQACFTWIVANEGQQSSGQQDGCMTIKFTSDEEVMLDAVATLGILFHDQSRLAEAERMYKRALQGYEKALGPEHPSTLATVNNLGTLFMDQGRCTEAERMYQRALQGYEKALGPEHPSTLATVNNLGNLSRDQGRLTEAEEMFQRALQGYEKALGLEHTSTLHIVNNLGTLFMDQGRRTEAEEMLQQALQGREKALGPEHTSTLDTINNYGILFENQDRLAEAEEMFQRALQGREKALGLEHTSTLHIVHNLGTLFRDQGRLAEAEEMFQRALQGREKALGLEHTSTLDTVYNSGILFRDQGKLTEAEEMFQRALQGYEKTLGLEHTSTLNTVHCLENLFLDQGRLAEAEEMSQLVLQGREEAFSRRDR